MKILKNNPWRNQKIIKKSSLITAIVLLGVIFISAVLEQKYIINESDTDPMIGLYFGQEPPGTIPRIFAPGIVSLEEYHDFKGAFSINGREYYFCRHLLPEMIPTLYVTKVVEGIWTDPIPLAIAKGPRTFHPCVSHDNQRLFFYWQFKDEESQESGYYSSYRTDTGWSTPSYAGKGMYLTTDNSGLYYSMEIEREDQPKFYLNKMIFEDGHFTQYERLEIIDHYGMQTHPCVAPDGSYFIFDTQSENSHLFVCFKDDTGDWGDAIDLTSHGLPPGARGAYVSQDGEYLFYGFNGDIYWVSTHIIKELKPKYQD